MSKFAVSVWCDLEAPAEGERAERVRTDLLDQVKFPHADGPRRGVYLTSFAGGIVKITADSWSSGNYAWWQVLDGLAVVRAEVDASGSDHFPTAGRYEAKGSGLRGIGGATATVEWLVEHNYPASQEAIEHAFGEVTSRTWSDLRVVVPAVMARNWSANLLAPTVSRVLRAYDLLRSGRWQPSVPFADRLPEGKIVQVPVRFDSFDDQD